MGRIKKLLAAALLLCITVCFAGCGEEKLVSEDYVESNCRNSNMNAIMKTDTGYYYSQNGSLSLHYYDAKNGKNMYLCNKPECRHEGDEFCAATSDKYQVLETILYSGNLYINAIEKTETQYEYKLLKASLDGSALSEVITYLAVDNIGVMPFIYNEYPRCMVMHRNKAFLPYSLCNTNNEEIGYMGTAIYDMESGEVTFLGDKEQGFEVKNCCFTGYGEYLYYVAVQKYKNELCRYNFIDGSVEKFELEKGFRGVYTVVDDNTIFYKRAQTDLCSYHIDTKENVILDSKEWFGIVTYFDDHSENNPHYSTSHAGFDDVISDGEYVYVAENYSFKTNKGVSKYPGQPNGETLDFAEITVLDKTGRFLNSFRLNSKQVLGYEDTFTLHFVDDTVYMQTPFMVYECSKEDFVAGNANFKEVYSQDIGIYSVKENEGWGE